MEKLAAGDPQHIGAYRVLARLGAGGMGRVYLARSDRGPTVAVKLVRRELAGQSEFRSRFRQEVAAARRVRGVRTAPVLDADTEAELPWLATGYVAGPTLQSVVSGSPVDPGATSGHGPLPERSVRVLGSGLAHALRDIHATGLVHGDLKPSNVLVTTDGPCVIDFGVARALEAVIKGDLTRTGSFLGSPGFMSPEQVRGDQVTTACDVFCLGSLLLYAATGRLPFGVADNGVQALMVRIALAEPDLSGLPEGLLELVRDCLRKDPAARPTTADILRQLGAPPATAGELWLPGELLAELGQHAVQLLEYEDPAGQPRAAGVVARTESPPWVAPGVHGMPTMIVAAAPAPVSRPAAGPVTAPGAASAQAPVRTPPFAPVRQPLPQPYDQAQAPYDQAQAPFGPTAPLPRYRAEDLFDPAPPAGGRPPAPEPPPRATRSRRSTLTLIAVAAVVVLGVGGSVYAFMNSGGPDDDRNTRVSDTPDTQAPGAPSAPAPTGAPSATPSARAPQGDVPKEFLGTWTGSLDTGAGPSARKLVVQQGRVGTRVLSLTADGPEGGSYHCVFQAPLVSSPRPGAALHIGPSRVTVGKPMSSCTPGEPTELTILPDGTLRRTTTGGESLTYTRNN